VNDRDTANVIVVGAGLAGLRCAQVLNDHGLHVELIEKSDHVGGRLRTFTIDGYVIDEGFQLINPSYPELSVSGVLDNFDLRAFEAIIRFVGDGGNFTLADPRRFPFQALAGLIKGRLSVRDAVAFGAVLGRSRLSSAKNIMAQPDSTTREGLLSAGVSAFAIDTVLQPFLRGTFLDDALETSWRYAQLVLKSFVQANPGTHPQGIEALAQAFIEKCDKTTLRLNTEVHSIGPREVSTNQGTFTAKFVVLASDGTTQSSLLDLPPVQWRRQTTWWWSLPKLQGSGALRIDLDDQLLSSALDLSSRAPERSPQHRSLVATPMNGQRPTQELEGRARQSVAKLFNVTLGDVELVTTTVVRKALPATLAPLTSRSGAQVEGVFCAGDYLETPSIQGALASGAKAARAVLKQSNLSNRNE
jgi:phytoene dehydrogenase-like protein